MTIPTPTVHLAKLARMARGALETVEQNLRPDPASSTPRDPSPADSGPTTQEILLPRNTGEAPSNRARRQAQDYLERRRRQLREELRRR